jgi:hypothetical protein
MMRAASSLLARAGVAEAPTAPMARLSARAGGGKGAGDACHFRLLMLFWVDFLGHASEGAPWLMPHHPVDSRKPSNNGPPLSNNGPCGGRCHCLSADVNGRLAADLWTHVPAWSTRHSHEETLQTLALIAAILSCASPAAACYADYRAQKDSPFGLHYGVIEFPTRLFGRGRRAGDCGPQIAAEGWQLLQVISVFDDSGLDARRSDAGAYFLRF